MTAPARVADRTVPFPVVVRDASVASAMFLVPSRAARRLLPGPELAIAEPIPGRAIISLAAIDYLDNDLGTYREFAMSLIVRERGASALPFVGLPLAFRSGKAGAYIHRLPVTTQFSRDAGRGIWGYPKIVAEITFDDTGDRRVARLDVDGVHAVTLTVRRGGRRGFPEAPLVSYGATDGPLRRTTALFSGDGLGFRLGGASIEVGPHEIGRELATLGFPRRALSSSWIEHMRASFGPPQSMTP
jgi:hypothetical protein